MPKLTINGNEIEVENGLTVLQACEQAGLEIPRFCYHERLSIAGNCRMCLVEMERAPKLIASCAMPVGEGMVIHTDNEKVRKARENVMELLLINHPLDCPICDQGGECDLQDQAMAYGGDKGRYTEEKRAVKDKDFGPIIRPFMTRCIHCTRCVRFTEEVAGTSDLCGTFRGDHTEIGTYVQSAVKTELAGNLVDLCPVGALTSKPYSYTARPWELKKTESIDVFDAVGTNVRLDSRANEVLRVLPRLNEEVNEEWLADKGRYAIDGLKTQRLDRPYVRKDGKLTAVSWDEAFKAIADKLDGLDGSKFAALAGDMVDAESMYALKLLAESLGSKNIDCRQDGAKYDPSVRASYLFNTTIEGIDEADACLIIGSNTRWEAPIINARLRKRYINGGFKAAMVGENLDLTFGCEHLGETADILSEIASGKHDFAKVLKSAEKPMLIIGQGALSREDGAAILAVAKQIADKFGLVSDEWNGFNVLHTAAARVGGLEMGFVPGEGALDTAAITNGDAEVVYLLGADEIDTSKLANSFVIYQGHNGDAGAQCADVILPGAAYTEKDGTYVNTEGRLQYGAKAVFAPGEAKEDWTILRALSAVIGKTLPFDSIEQLRAKLAEVSPTFANPDDIQSASWDDFGAKGDISATALISPIENYYMTDPVSRVSKTMAECTAALINPQQRTGTNG
ncbi:NADH-quinone oxidoreductase subunit NuoG [Terasakiella sp. A23]|uniref:NADH-quinone oxidoreductase subunit NuoG n=1 Tax=Terasakiella sp. FCG-A23 TaxID=3080561 RepID=UPI0029547C36|nr:NADH-quinone oxidoreductase subunit NuoG [Terasakiella sp. A23]MDV7338835.1 NADH-quinone oxidoreductase subunit NuoG [Terasakiella sp. A23]